MAAVIGNRNISLGVLGGTLITAACYSGGEVFGCSPYDAATTAYLMATYPLHWQAIRDYGFANPQLVPWINEDNDLIVSLVSVGKVRKVDIPVGAYAKLGYYHTTQDTIVRVRTKVVTATGTYPCLIRVSEPYAKTKAIWLSNATSIGYNYGGTEYLGIATFTNETHTFEINKNKFLIDGVVKHTANAKVFENTDPTTETYLCSSTDGASRFNREQIEFVELGESEDAMAHRFLPFKRNGQMELLDIVTGTLATRVGTFTELIE